MKSDKLFDGLKDRMVSVGMSALEPVHKGDEVPPVDEVQPIWEEQNRAFGNTDDLKKNEFVIRKGNEFYYTGSYFKALLMMSATRQQAVVAGLSQAHGLGKDDGFVETSKQLRQRIQQ